MAVLNKLVLFLITIFSCVTAHPTPDPNGFEPEAKYIVTLQRNLSPKDFKSHLERLNTVYSQTPHSSHHRPPSVDRTYAIGDYRAYSGVFDRDTITAIWNDTQVAQVEIDAHFTVQRKFETQLNAPWGLAVLSMPKKRGGFTTYRYDKSAGNGTFAYVVDSGINTKHIEFEGRASNGYTVIGNDFGDIQGHGTHVAGIIGGKTYGVAKQTQIIGVKVFLNDGGYNSDVLDGYQWAVRDIVTKGRQGRSVINMSLGGPYSYAMNVAVEAAWEMGILTVVAAGNAGSPARFWSPASAKNALTVGAINNAWQEADFSNYGPEVNILAPGVDIPSAFVATDNATAVLSGTSMAAPHVAGLALYLAVMEQTNTAKELRDKILELALKGKVKEISEETHNLVAHNDLF